MKRMKMVAVALVASLIAGTVYADDVVVTGTETLTGTIDGNVFVLETGNATLRNLVVNGDVISLGGGVRVGTGLGGTVELIKGDVKIGAGGRFATAPFRNANITIEGNVKADGALNIVVNRATVFGDIKITNSGNVGSTFSGLSIQNSNVGGDVKVTDNIATLIRVNGNTILGHVKVFDSMTTLIGSDIFTINNNNIAGDLKCGGNNPEPVVTGNVVLGDVKCD